MNILYFDCYMGVAGDMLCGALWDLIEDKNSAINLINNLNIPNVSISFTQKDTKSIVGTHMNVLVNGKNEEEISNISRCHNSLDDVCKIIDNINVDKAVKQQAKDVYAIIAKAEAQVHNTNIGAIHFHEVGMFDAIADVTICCLLINMLNVDKIISSAINTGYGTVKCAHGILPVPAPATSVLLKDTLAYSDGTIGELATPTGVALLKYFAKDFGNMPPMSIKEVGVGVGNKEFDKPNCVRAFLGEANSTNNVIAELSCNLDDMTGEDIAFACDMLSSNGALDVYTESISMKKGRPAIKLTVMCKDEDSEKLAGLMFKHTTTLGVRKNLFERYEIDRKIERISTSLGDVSVKIAKGYGAEKIKCEYEDLVQIARENNISISQARKLIFDDINNNR